MSWGENGKTGKSTFTAASHTSFVKLTMVSILNIYLRELGLLIGRLGQIPAKMPEASF